jgi:hypothetical protein
MALKYLVTFSGNPKENLRVILLNLAVFDSLQVILLVHLKDNKKVVCHFVFIIDFIQYNKDLQGLFPIHPNPNHNQ